MGCVVNIFLHFDQFGHSGFISIVTDLSLYAHQFAGYQ